MMKPKILIIMSFCLILTGCNIKAIFHEMDVKHQYSVMQTIEYRFREVAHDEKGYLLIENSLESDTNLLLLPIKGQDIGYVVFVLNPYFGEDKEILKYIPEDKDFILTPETLKIIKSQVDIESQMKEFLTEYAKSNILENN